jgi:hypothetical protein
MLLLIVVLLLLFGGGGGYYGYSRWGSRGGLGIVGTRARTFAAARSQISTICFGWQPNYSPNDAAPAWGLVSNQSQAAVARN